MKIIVNEELCPQNHKCPAMAICPQGAISQKDNNSLPVIDHALCIMCGKCKNFCPKGAFQKVE